ncbi:MAG: glycosyltransferase family 4 protein [Gemmatimonadota bacterium]|jgi:glycosyltransferase involved in cell wall biosynthesis
MNGTGIERVLFVHDYSGLGGGAELVVHHLRDRFLERGIDARLFASTADEAVAGAEPDHVFDGGTGRLRALREVLNPSAYLRLGRVLRDFDPDAVYLGMFLTQASPAILPRLTERAVIWAPNEFRPICPKGSRMLPEGTRCRDPVGRACLAHRCFRPHGLAPRLLQLSLLRRWLHVVDRTLAPSRAFAEAFERHGIAVDGILRLPVSPGVGRRSRGRIPLVAFAGRLVAEKGCDIAIRAFAGVVEAHPDARLLIAGDGPERAALEALAERIGIGNRIEFAGFLPRSDLERRLEAAWVQCVPSLWDEPYGLVVIEALARGTPVVASAAGALPELVEDARTGYLVPPGEPALLEAAIRRILADPVAADSLGDAARRTTLETFGADAAVDRLLTEFEGIRRDREN